jgi:ABC-2 type transport system permease protein
LIATFTTEMSKQLRRVRTYVALAVMVAIPILMTFALKYGGHGERGERDGDALFRLARQSGIVVPAFALTVMSGFMLIVVVAMFAGDVVAGEASWGNLRYMLVRPLSRSRVLTAKLATVVVFTCIATLLITVTGLVAGTIAFGWHDVNVPLLGIHISEATLVKDLFLATAYTAWNMMAIVALGFMVSSMTDAPVGAITAAAAFGIISEILDAIPPLGFLRYGLPLHYLSAWTDLIRVGPTGSELSHVYAEMWRGVVVQVPYIVVFLTITYVYFRRKDISS